MTSSPRTASTDGPRVLLTCAGRRGYLLQHFRDALRGHGQVLAADSSPDAPALCDADQALVVPPVGAPGHLEALLQHCEQLEVDLLVSLNDLELPVLAAAVDRFAAVGTTVVVSSPGVVDDCFDKWRTFALLDRLGIDTAATWVTLEDALAALEAGRVDFPLVVKPRWGTASLGVEVVVDEDELRLAHGLLRRKLSRSLIGAVSRKDPDRAVLVQAALPGVEHGLDVVNDLTGRHVATFARRKLSMRAGETDRAITVVDERLTRLGRLLGERVRHVGVLDCDVFVDGDRVAVLELNPRFGGGYPFSHAAGADVPAALLAWAAGRPARPEWLRVRPGVSIAKTDGLRVLRAVVG